MEKKENKILIIYTIFVLLAEMVHISLGGAPPMYMRLIYIAAHLLCCLYNIKLIPIFVTISMIMQNFSAVFGEFLPATIYFNIVLISYCYFQLRYIKSNENNHFPVRTVEYHSLFLFALYILLNSLIYPNISLFCNLLFSFIFLACLCRLDNAYLKALVKYICIAMTLSSLLILLNLDKILTEYATSQGSVQRLSWKDSNYTSFFISIVTLITLFYASKTPDKRTKKYLYAIAFIFIICLCLLISRGSILSLAIACIFYFRRTIFSSKIIGYGLLLGVFCLFLYDSGLLDGVIDRFNSEDMKDGSGRTTIWKTGLNTFQSKGLMTIFIGEGNGAANKMALLGGIYFSPHNNYLEFLYNFGVIGLTLFIIWLSTSFFGSSDEKKTLIIFIMANCMTVCPFIYVQPIWLIIPLIMIWDSRINKIIYE